MPWLRRILACGTVVACTVTYRARAEAQERQPAAFSVARWHDWFATEEYGNDPYFFFNESETGATRCPAETRLTLMRTDSLKVRFEVDRDQLPGDDDGAGCVVAYSQLRGKPVRDQLGPNRTMWRLQAQGNH